MFLIWLLILKDERKREGGREREREEREREIEKKIVYYQKALTLSHKINLIKFITNTKNFLMLLNQES